MINVLKAFIWELIMLPLVFTVNLIFITPLIDALFEPTGNLLWLNLMIKAGAYGFYLVILGLIPYMIITGVEN